ncbi:hypothetical protein VTL71DRAFT_171 [Oculimacula yallundae]|uniref:BTB domain-containing protein n=1 Tax=Oculimacula yallundae TaxID=86028 RepID=A0ABR4CZ80_9HELO
MLKIEEDTSPSSPKPGQVASPSTLDSHRADSPLLFVSSRRGVYTTLSPIPNWSSEQYSSIPDLTPEKQHVVQAILEKDDTVISMAEEPQEKSASIDLVSDDEDPSFLVKKEAQDVLASSSVMLSSSDPLSGRKRRRLSDTSSDSTRKRRTNVTRAQQNAIVIDLTSDSENDVPSEVPIKEHNSPPAASRKLKPVSSDWSRRFIAIQRSPRKRVATRRVLKAKTPLVLPKLSRGRKYKPANLDSCKARASKSNGGRSASGLGLPVSDAFLATNGSAGSVHALAFEKARRYQLEYERTYTKPWQYSHSSGLYSSEQKLYSGPFVPITEKPTFLVPHGNMIRISLGSALFTVYAEFLCWHCPLLAEEYHYTMGQHHPENALVSRYLYDMDDHVFGLFVNWLYTEKVANKHGKPPFQHRLMELWVLAKRLEMPGLSNAALDALEARRRQEGAFRTKSLAYVYEKTKEGDALRRYIVDVCSFVPSFLEEIQKDHLPEDFMHDMFNASLEERVKTEEDEVDASRYHLKLEERHREGMREGIVPKQEDALLREKFGEKSRG